MAGDPNRKTTADDQPLPEVMRRFLRELGHDPPPGHGVPLSGGVSSDIWRVDIGTDRICLKRALPTLRVAAEWKVPLERSRYEYAWFCRVREIVPDAVPPLVGQHSGGELFAMHYLDPVRHPLWKQQLLAGVVNPGFAGTVGATLARIHAATAGESRCARAFDSDALFYKLRLEPYLLATARRHLDLAAPLQALAARTAATRLALVHGDVSPKNILAGPRGPVFLDAECAWYGDPAFDLAFCLNHLLLKCLPVPEARGLLRASYDVMAHAYLQAVTWESPAVFEQRCAAILPGLLLARVDGKSPVEYVTTEPARDLVRRTARPLISNPAATLEAVASCWHSTLTS